MTGIEKLIEAVRREPINISLSVRNAGPDAITVILCDEIAGKQYGERINIKLLDRYVGSDEHPYDYYVGQLLDKFLYEVDRWMKERE